MAVINGMQWFTIVLGFVAGSKCCGGVERCSWWFCGELAYCSVKRERFAQKWALVRRSSCDISRVLGEFWRI